jgi:hypothetical protein
MPTIFFPGQLFVFPPAAFFLTAFEPNLHRISQGLRWHPVDQGVLLSIFLIDAILIGTGSFQLQTIEKR